MPSSDPPASTGPSKTETTENARPQPQRKGSMGKASKPQESGTGTEPQKPSGAELKKQKQAEKAARRAQAINAKEGGGAVPTPPGPIQKTEGTKTPKAQQKKGGASVVEVRNLPVRGGAQKPAPAVQLPAMEDKTVEFFRHLYKTRTTSIAGAGKEVHPAVLALGLQMSNYTICGSCARLVATLQAFKRVSYL